ncbi:hypothetical protein ACHWQZ_G001503 [Mnemiopsis leidyi]
MSTFIFLFIATVFLSFRHILGIRLSEYPPEFLILPEDSELTLTCKVDPSLDNSSEPVSVDPSSVQIQWYYQQTDNGQEWFLFESEILEYSSVQISYEGFYFCKGVINNEEIVRSNVTRLRIAYLKEMFLRVPGQVYTVEGSTVEFECEPPASYPPANVMWFKDSQPIDNTRSFMKANYTLVIVGTLPEDSGNYQCVAENSITNETRTSLEGELYVTERTDGDVDDDSEKPSPSIASYYTTVNEGESTSLLCAFQGVPYPTYRWYFENGTEILDRNNTFSYQYEKQVLQIDVVSRDMAGLFLCQGSNVAGSSVINITLFVDYTEELGFSKDLPEEFVFTQEENGNRTEIICFGKGTPPLDVRWYGDNDTLLSSSSSLSVDIGQVTEYNATCQVQNKNGTVRQSTKIKVKAEEGEDEPDNGDGAVATVQCYGDRMSLRMSEKRDFSSFHLFDSGCTFPGNSTVIETPLERCGTKAYYNDSHIIYKNQVTGVTGIGAETYSPISRGDSWQITYECAYKRTGSTDNVAWEARGQITVDIKGTGSFTFVLDLYEDSEFVKKRDSSQYPVRLSVQDDIYLEVALLSPDENLSLTVADIRASDSPSGNGGSFVYSLVEKGCIVDSTFKYIDTENIKKKRFTLKAFHFMSSQSIVYVHAFVKICDKSNNSCTEICTVDKVQKRSLNSENDRDQREYHIFQGPFISYDSSPIVRAVSSSPRRKKAQMILLSYLLFLMI